MTKWGLILKSLGITALLLVARFIIDRAGLDVLTLSTLITAFIGGAIFTVAIIFTGTLTDYKESERIPGELAASIRALHTETNFIRQDQVFVAAMQSHVLAMLSVINGNFRGNRWDTKEIGAAMEVVNRDIFSLIDKNVAPPMVVKLRSEMTAVDRISNRIRQIGETSFIPAVYSIAELATAAAILLLFFVRLDPLEGVLLFTVLSALLISLILLIRDMDNPFEVGKQTYADVDLFILFDLEEELRGMSGGPGSAEAG